VTPTVLPGDLILVRSAGWVGRGIRQGTCARFNHVRWAVTDAGRCVEARPHGAGWARVMPGDVVVRVPLTDAQRALVPEVAREFVGVPYAFLDVAAIGLAKNGVALPSVRARLERPDRLFCSQLADLGLHRIGFEVFSDGRPFQAVDPGDLAERSFRAGWASGEWDGSALRASTS